VRTSPNGMINGNGSRCAPATGSRRRAQPTVSSWLGPSWPEPSSLPSWPEPSSWRPWYVHLLSIMEDVTTIANARAPIAGRDHQQGRTLRLPGTRRSPEALPHPGGRVLQPLGTSWVSRRPCRPAPAGLNDLRATRWPVTVANRLPVSHGPPLVRVKPPQRLRSWAHGSHDPAPMPCPAHRGERSLPIAVTAPEREAPDRDQAPACRSSRSAPSRADITRHRC